MRLTDRVLALHPAVVTLAFVILFIGGGLAANARPLGTAAAATLFSVSMLALFGPLLLWHYSLYRAASDRNTAAVGHRGRRALLFLLTAVATGIHLALLPALMALAPGGARHSALAAMVSASMVVGCLAYFAAVWAAANALSRFDDRSKSVELHKTLGTFLLSFYLPIGVWVIYPRIRRLLAAPAPT